MFELKPFVHSDHSFADTTLSNKWKSLGDPS